MTGFGGFSPPSQDTGALKAISSKDYAFANKDFVKNIAYLNQATDSLAVWAQTAQSGIDAGVLIRLSRFRVSLLTCL